MILIANLFVNLASWDQYLNLVVFIICCGKINAAANPKKIKKSCFVTCVTNGLKCDNTYGHVDLSGK